MSIGRAAVILGRGSFTESFRLFRFDLRDWERHLIENQLVFPPVENLARRWPKPKKWCAPRTTISR